MLRMTILLDHFCDALQKVTFKRVPKSSSRWFPYYLLHRAEEKKDRALNEKNWSCNLYNFFRLVSFQLSCPCLLNNYF
jgi:hypothetical protein